MIDMNKAFFLRVEDRAPEWHVIDAEGLTLGRLSTQIATLLRGRHKPQYTAHTDSGDYVIVLNCDKFIVTGNKMLGKEYISYSGWRGGKKVVTLQNKLAAHPTDIIRLAVKGMLPRTSMGRQVIDKLKLYTGDTHPHIGQAPQLVK
ncbi:MAG: large subunit ribosomal protein [Candidatus Dependentiae bacterium]|nr:large subunit ribosomal protein [Candidatus Dependentiae bacterium]